MSLHQAIAPPAPPPEAMPPPRASKPGRGQWWSSQLLGNRHEIEILHAGSVYRLRVTSLGKLILTK